MMTLSFRRFSVPMMFAFASLSAGVIGGTSAVYGLSANGYGPASGRPVYAQAAAATTPEPSSTYDECQQCSERDLGYHWAALRQIASTSECPMDSWEFRRGCVAYMRDTGGV